MQLLQHKIAQFNKVLKIDYENTVSTNFVCLAKFRKFGDKISKVQFT